MKYKLLPAVFVNIDGTQHYIKGARYIMGATPPERIQIDKDTIGFRHTTYQVEDRSKHD